MLSTQIAFVADDKFDVLGDEINAISPLNQLSIPSKAWIDFNDDWASLRPPEFNARWPPAKVESSQTAQRNFDDTLMLLISQQGRKGRSAIDEMRQGPEVSSGNPNDLTSHYVGDILGALNELFDQYPRRRPPYVLPAQQIGRMFGQLVDIAAQSDTAAPAAYGWLNNHRQADIRGSAFYVRRIRRQAITRYWNAGLREKLTLSKFVAASFNRCGVWSR
ncbi:hypothetical protein X757_31760 [Mesorhizobium sp. LSHC414A00]|nr:hypothetical protein X757_31760 [Mesorhizobium sp. LSHC414A00]